MYKKLDQRGFHHVLMIALIVVVVVALGFAGWYVWDKNKANDNANTTTPTPTPSVTATATPTPTPNPTADWQTYTNTKYGYSIKYPTDWTLSSNSNENGASFNKAGMSNYIADIYQPKAYSSMVGINDINPSNTSFEDYVTKYSPYLDRNETVTANEVIQTQSGQAYYVSYSGQWFSDIYIRHEAFLKDNTDLVYEFNLDKDASSADQNIFKLFVSTFTLTN